MKQKSRKRFIAVVTAWLMLFTTIAGIAPVAAQDPGGYVPREMQTPAGEYMPNADKLIYTFRDGEVEEIPADATAVYEVPLRLWNNWEDRASMGNGAVDQMGQVVVTPDKTYFEVRLVGLRFLGMYGHLLKMSYNPADPTAQPASTADLKTPADVIQYRTDFSLNTRKATTEEIEELPADYPNRDKAVFGEVREFSHHLRMEYPNFDFDAAMASDVPYNTFIRIAVVVDAMKALTGSDPYGPEDAGAQFARLQFDFTNAKKVWAKHNVSFDPDNGEAVTNVTVEEGSMVAEPTEPTKEYFEFTGWYADDVLYDFTQPVTGPLALKAGWKAIPGTKDDLQAALDKARKVINISPELAGALDLAEQVLGDPYAIQPQVDDALAVLNAATPAEVTITLQDSDNTEIKQVQAFVGDPFDQPEDPAAKPNNTFAHWAKRANSNKAEEFPFTVSKNTTLYAVYWYDMNGPVRRKFRQMTKDIQFIYDNLKDKSNLKMSWPMTSDTFLDETFASYDKPEITEQKFRSVYKQMKDTFLPVFTHAWRLDRGEMIEAEVGDYIPEALVPEPHYREGEAEPRYKLKKYEVPVRLHQYGSDTSLSMGSGGIAPTSYFYEEDGKGNFDIRVQAVNIFGLTGHLWGVKYKEGDPKMPPPPEYINGDDLVYAKVGEYFRDISLVQKDANPKNYPINYPVQGESFERMVREFPHTFRLFDDSFDMTTASEDAWGYSIAMQMVVDAMDAMQSVPSSHNNSRPTEDPNLYDIVKFDTWTPEAELRCDFKHATLIYDKTDLRAAMNEVAEIENPSVVLTAAIAEATQVFDDYDTNQDAVDKAKEALYSAKIIDELIKGLDKADEKRPSGWYQAEDGYWYCGDKDGGLIKNAWLNRDGKWYRMASEGHMLTDAWVYADGNWYRVDETGALITNQWLQVNGVWYYATGSGRIAQNQWVKVGNGWYWATGSGRIAQKQWVKADNGWYWATGSGRIAQKQWVYVSGEWYYATGSGRMAQNQWVYSNGTWYYAKSDGRIAINETITVKGVKYRAAASGAIQ